jgi:hypothetical protein
VAKVCEKHDVLGDTCWCCEQEKKKVAAPVATGVKPKIFGQASKQTQSGVKVFSNPAA